MIPVQTTVALAVDVFAQLVGLAVLAGVLAAVAALAVRWYAREPVPTALALLVGLSGVAIYLNTTTVLEQVIAGETVLSEELEVALFNSSAFVAGTGGALAGRRVGDRFARDVVLNDSTTRADSELGQFVRHVGRVITVTVPEEIDDVVGYDPVPEQTKESLAGESFVFPRNLTRAELRERLIDRLKSDYAVGTVDVELAEDGTVAYLAVGSRPAGIGPTLPPATNAVAVRADPAFAASTGDLVQVWETDPMRRVLTGELRGVAGDVVTLAIDSGDTPKVDPRREYRLVTLPVDDRPEREFAALLRSVDQTFSTATVEAGSPLHGLPVGALSLLVVAVEPDDGDSVVLPERTYLLAPGDTIAAIGLPEALRRLEAAAEPLDPGVLESVASHETEQSRPETPETKPPAATGSAATDDHEGPVERTDAAVDTGDEPAEALGRSDEPVQPSADSGSEDSSDPPIAGQADASTFSELKVELESSEPAFDSELDESAEHSESDDFEGSEPADDDDRSDRTEAEADRTDDDSDMFDDDLSGIDLEDGAESDERPRDDLSALDIDDDADDGSELRLDDDDLSGLDLGDEDEMGGGEDETEDDETGVEEDDEAEDDETEGGEDGETGSDEDDTDDEEGGDSDEEGDGSDDSDDESGGGGSTFAQLKEEFESGDADWEDDISDSPGGDMRLDE
ncbi:TrkA C-terminal domain-containing protein [Halovenus marina]|uniref:TrkA C-terminal domain-containing protein n=1 Tax=Halovenus marina TaxID=3396621 RepID=UPI003F57DBF9